MPISDSAATELAQLLSGASAGELIPELVRQGLQALIEAEAAAALGADRHQRTAERRGHRNGSRERLLATPAGDVQLRIPWFRMGSCVSSLLESRWLVGHALWAVVMVAYVSGSSKSGGQTSPPLPRHLGRSLPQPALEVQRPPVRLSRCDVVAGA